ncbi:uncharacterized protein CDAR_501981 [Caerostris darwini]|uniref:PH domain-containing protein n=1 Tax=Caerostris darwini TaxID=1538125 RepID=A0AAV4PLV9_9ARAC|nr:uncharacterized protein CDAR_501981 [Caerostris darwini]
MPSFQTFTENLLEAWHKRYFVLRDETQDRSPCLEMYEKDELFTAPLGITGPKLILDLGQCVHIGFTSDSTRFPYALVIVCQGRSPLILAAEDELSARSWLLALGLITHKGNAGHCQRTSFNPPPSLLLEAGGRRRNKHVYRETCSLPQESSAPLSVESTAATLLPEEYNDNDMDRQRTKSRKKEASKNRLDEPATKKTLHNTPKPL